VKSQVSAHKDAVSLFDSESRHGTDADLKQFAGATLPTIKSHLDMVNNLAKAPAKTASTQAATIRRLIATGFDDRSRFFFVPATR
jgi:hypothetical protein